MKKRVNITVEDRLLKILDNMAEERGVDRSTMISLMIYDSNVLVELQKNTEAQNFANNMFLVK